MMHFTTYLTSKLSLEDLNAACVLLNFDPLSHHVYHLCAAIIAVRVWTVIIGTAVSVPVDSQGQTVASVSD